MNEIPILASQTWCLLRLLPMIIGDKIPEDDPYWNNFLVLLQIVDYVCAPVTSSSCVGHLWQLIADHHETFTELYPHRPLTPKFHYLVHMPEWILK